MAIDLEKLDDRLEKMRVLNQKMFSLSPHLTVCSPETQLIHKFITKYPLNKRELKLLDIYVDKSTVAWHEIEAEGAEFEAEFRKRWMPMWDKLLTDTQREIWDHRWTRLSFHLEDLKGIKRNQSDN